MPRRLEYKVSDKYEGRKVVHFLRGEARLSVRLIAKLKQLEDGILLNGKHARTIDILKAGDIICLNIPREGKALEGLEFPLEVLYEDDDLLVVNKPPNLPVHPSRKHQGNTLANAVTWYLEQSGKAAGSFRAMGRLDKGTSGGLVCALNRYVASRLGGEIQKTYLAIVGGVYEGEGTINTPIYRPDPMRTGRACGPEGEAAVTHWRALASKDDMTLMRIKLETGRTHQIRVHFAHLGTPLVGDDMYGGIKTDQGHQFLHCESLVFNQPVSGQNLRLRAPLPKAMEDLARHISGGLSESLTQDMA